PVLPSFPTRRSSDLAWALWPRRYGANLTAAKGETILGPWVKIGADGHVTVAIPQAEHGQGVFTTLPQIVADELGADWRTVGVQPDRKSTRLNSSHVS